LGARIVGVYWSPWDAWFPEGQPYSSLRGKYRWHLMQSSGVRDEVYMRRAFADAYPSGLFVVVDRAGDWVGALAGASTAVLLYPDPIGYGFGRIEARLRTAVPPGCVLRALNGRRRDFELDSTSRRALTLRRMCKGLLLGELAFSTAFVLLTPFLVGLDLLRGRR